MGELCPSQLFNFTYQFAHNFSANEGIELNFLSQVILMSVGKRIALAVKDFINIRAITLTKKLLLILKMNLLGFLYLNSMLFLLSDPLVPETGRHEGVCHTLLHTEQSIIIKIIQLA